MGGLEEGTNGADDSAEVQRAVTANPEYRDARVYKGEYSNWDGGIDPHLVEEFRQARFFVSTGQLPGDNAGMDSSIGVEFATLKEAEEYIERSLKDYPDVLIYNPYEKTIRVVRGQTAQMRHDIGNIMEIFDGMDETRTRMNRQTGDSAAA